MMKKPDALKTAFYVLWMMLGLTLGIRAFCLFHKAADVYMQLLYGAGGIFFVVMALYFIGEFHPDVIPRLLNRFRNATSGGWPWQQGRLWWIPFVLFLSPAMLLGCYFGSIYFHTYGHLRSDHFFWANLYRFCLITLNGYAAFCLPFALLLCYGRAHARKWTRKAALLAAALSVISNITIILLGFYNDTVHTFFTTFGPDVLVATAIPVMLMLMAILNGVLGLLFYRQLQAATPTPAPAPTPASPWLARDLWLIMIVPILLIPLIPDRSYFLIYGYLRLGPYVLPLFLILMRSSFKSFFGTPQGQRPAAENRLKTAGRFLLLLLPALGCFYLNLVLDWFSQKTFFLPLSSGWYTHFLMVMLSAAGSEILFRGIFWAFFSRCLGVKNALVFLPLLTISLLCTLPYSWICLPGAIAFSLLFHFSMTFLRYRTDSVPACIGVRMAMIVVLWGNPITADFFTNMTRLYHRF